MREPLIACSSLPGMLTALSLLTRTRSICWPGGARRRRVPSEPAIPGIPGVVPGLAPPGWHTLTRGRARYAAGRPGLAGQGAYGQAHTAECHLGASTDLR